MTNSVAYSACRLEALKREAERRGLNPPKEEPPDPTDRRVTFADLKIRTKGKKLATFEPNAIQAVYLDQICPGWRAADYDMAAVMEIILKARQFGFSTLIAALFFVNTVNTPNTTTVVIGMDSNNTNSLFGMVQTMFEHLPAHKKPKPKYANRTEFFWPEIGSRYYVGSAENLSFGRGWTIHNLHASEVAFWRNAETLLGGLMEAVPQDGNAFIETTANGVGNWYHTEYQLAEAAQSVFTPRFYAWFRHPEYRRPSPPNFARTKEEEKLAAQFGLDDEQLEWRRWKVRARKKLFPQEYPATAAEAFLTSGNPYFDRDVLMELSRKLAAPAFDPIDVDVPTDRFPRLAQARNHVFHFDVKGSETLGEMKALSVWEAPIPGRLYVIAADTAEGINDKGDHDFDAADVFDAETWTQVAHLHGRWDTHEYGLILAELGFWYNTALLGIERNNHGHAVINAALYTANYPEARDQPNGLYFHQEYDEDKNPTTMRPGWPTTAKTKYFALDGLATSLLDGDIHLRSRQTVSQLLTFVKLLGGKAGGEGRSHDDCVSAVAIAAALLKARPRVRQDAVYYYAAAAAGGWT